MKKMIVCLMTLATTQVFAVKDCLNYPVMNSQEIPYGGEITDQSDIISYAGCPVSTLVNGSIVMNLSKIETYNKEKRCVYKNGHIYFMCQL